MKKLMLVLLLSAAVSADFAVPRFPGVDTSNNCQCIGIGIEAPDEQDNTPAFDGTSSAKAINPLVVYWWVIMYLTGVGR